MKQISFATLWDGFKTDKESMQARNKAVKEYRAQGIKCSCFTLPNQLKKYDGIGQPNGGVCNVYMANVYN